MTTSDPLVLLHGLSMSARVWGHVVPLLSDRFDVVVPTADGHRGGAPYAGSVTFLGLVDRVERYLDGRGIDTAHVAGNSMGGFLAIELARRGRARSVCALAPAGFWTAGQLDHTSATDTVAKARRRATRARRVAPPLLRVGAVRRAALIDAAEHADRLTHEEAVQAMRDMVDCPVADDLLASHEQIAPLDPTPCPITVAWCEHDRIFPPGSYSAIARERIPQARRVVLRGVGHVPMIDDPRLTAQAIIEATTTG